jgi:hypothetical protein
LPFSNKKRFLRDLEKQDKMRKPATKLKRFRRDREIVNFVLHRHMPGVSMRVMAAEKGERRPDSAGLILA